MNPEQVSADIAVFTAPPPEQAAQAAKDRKEREKKEAAFNKKLQPEQIKAAAALTDSMKAEAEAGEKSRLLQQIADYIRLIKEYHPDRFELLNNKIKTASVKNSVEELRVWVKDMQNDLGKKGGLEMAKVLWVQGCEFFEKINENGRFGLDMTNLGQAAKNTVATYQMPDGSVKVGSAVPTLAEFACKHSSWFTTDVDTRMVIMFIQMVDAVNKMNKEAPNVARAETKAAGQKATDMVNNL